MPKKKRVVNAQSDSTKGEARLLPKFSLFFFDRPRLTALLFVVIFAFGLLSYTTLLKREGFP